MSRFYLNSLRRDNRAVPSPVPGQWQSDNGDAFLTQYAKDIDLHGQVDDVRAVHSVPSVFARPIQFAQALGSRDPQTGKSNSPLHAATVAQWRGLLALFALKDRFGFDLDLKRYKVPAAPAVAAATGAPGGVNDQHIVTMLRSHLPKPESDWESWHVISCGGRLVGATSPWTIVFTAAEYRCPESIPWQEKGLLTDPAKYLGKKSSTTELAILHGWVSAVLKAYEKTKWDAPSRLDEKMGALKRELDAWLKDLAAYADKNVQVDLEDPQVDENPYYFFTQRAGLSATITWAESDLLLKSSKGEETLVFSRAALDERARVWKGTFADRVQIERLASPRGARDWRAANNQAIPRPYVIAEDAFFPPKLVLMGMSDHSIRRGTDQYTLPLTPLFFEYFNAKDLVDKPDMLQLTVQADKVRVELNLPLKSGEYLKVKRSYDVSNDVVKIERAGVPAMAVWPDFFAEDWYANFAAYSGHATDTVLIAAPVNGDGLAMKATTNDGTQKNVRIWHSQRPVIGFAVHAKDQNTGGTTLCGMVLRSSLNAPPKPDDSLKWRVGVDFGTSNTLVMSALPGGPPKLLHLNGRTRLLTQANPVHLDNLAARFYPAVTREAPFVTALERVDHVATVEGGHWRYSPRYSLPLNEIGALVPNLKWGTMGGHTDPEPMQEYLRHLVRYVSCEARAAGASEVEFEWSYPLALPAGVQKAMKAFWNKFHDSFCSPEALTVKPTAGVAESDAICRRLAWIEPPLLPILTDALSITIDVGGGSTDVGFWTEKALIDQISVKLAGTDVLNPFAEDESFCKVLVEACNLEGTQWNQDLEKVFRDNPGVAFNKILAEARDGLGRPAKNGDPRRHPVVLAMHNPGVKPWVTVRSLIYLFFMGTTFYAGLQARKYIKGENESVLYFGGRGSSLLSWVSTDAADLRRILLAAFKAGLSQDPAVSPLPEVNILGPTFEFQDKLPLKQEVAGGLLSKPVGESAGPSLEDRKVTVGEDICRREDGTTLGFFEEVTAAEMAKLRLNPNLDASMFIILNRYLQENWKGLNLDEINLRNVRPSSTAVQEWVRRSAEPDGVLQPVFFSELRAAMEQYARNSRSMAAAG